MVRQLKRSQFMNELPLPFYINRCFHDEHNLPAEHSHDFIELVYLVSGSGEHLFEEESYPIHAGDVFIINPGKCMPTVPNPGRGWRSSIVSLLRS
ncbi:AraC family ligand binding domain-containing protein [Paenibacillus sp. CC-CFT747]|nr:AraC family ligand binding domain-containing protein [Paenibacillus sp. CC-CFT747]